CLLLCQPQLVEAFQIQPKLSARAKEKSQAQRGVADDRTCSVQDLCDPLRRHVEAQCKLSCAHLECLKFFNEVFAGMNSRDGHCEDPSDNQQFLRWTVQTLREAIQSNPPLIVNANAVFALTVATQCFKPVSRKSGEIFERCSSLHSIKLQAGSSVKTRKRLYASPGSKSFGPLVPIAGNQLTPHNSSKLCVTSSVQDAYRCAEWLCFHL